MELTGHRDQKTFQKYYKAPVEVLDRVMQQFLAGDSIEQSYCNLLDEENNVWTNLRLAIKFLYFLFVFLFLFLFTLLIIFVVCSD